MKQIIFVMAMLYPVLIMSQNTVFYRPCTNCPTGENSSAINTTYNYGELTPFRSSDVTSDFGARFPNKKYDWHKGVDYRPHGCLGIDGCRGTSITSILGGTVNRIYALHGMKMVSIEGDNGNHYGYGHIFNSRFIGINSNFQYINEGKFFIKHMEEYPIDKIYAIVDLENDNAFGPAEGTVNINVGNNQRILNVSTTVTTQQDLAPMGGSCCSFNSGTGSENDVLSVHLHLYQFRDIMAANLVRETHETNCMNPIHNLVHQSPSISVKWQLKGEHWWNNPVISPDGTQPNNFRVRALMQNVLNVNNNPVGESEKANKYSNVVNDVNKIELILKKLSDVNGVNFIGKKNQSYINLGGNLTNVMYPSSLALSANYGTWNKHGINAFAYDDYKGYPYDDYFFDAFYTRINNLSTKTITDIPKNVKYSDGNYSLQAKVHNINNLIFNSNIQNFRIDNFLPFISNFQFKVGSWTSSTVFYEIERKQKEGDADKNDDGYVSNDEHYYKIGQPSPTSKYYIEINTSEPVTQLSYKVKKKDQEFPYNSTLMTQIGNSKMIWRAELSQTLFITPLDELEFEITGNDLANNELVNIADMTRLIAEFNLPEFQIKIPTRKTNERSKLAWNNYPSKIGLDRFKVKMSGCQRSSSQEICDAIKLMEVTKALYGCSSVRLDVNDYVQGVEVTWTDENNNVISTNHEVFVSSTGRYCYKLQGEFGDDCCSREGCIFVLADDFEDKSIEIIPIIDPGCGSTGNKRGHVSLDVHNYPSGTTYSWSHNPNWNVHWTRVEPGQHSVTVTMPWGCKRSLDYTVENANDAIKIFEEVVPADCGQNNGEIHLSNTLYGEELISGFTLSWSNGATQTSLYNLAPGEYCVSLRYGLPVCPITKCITVPEKKLELSASITPNTNCANGNHNGAISLDILNGTPPYTIAWADNSSDLERINLKTGPYSVTVTDANGCRSSNIYNVPGTLPMSLTGTVSQDCGTKLYKIRLTNFPTNLVYFVILYKMENGVKELINYYAAYNGYEITDLTHGEYIIESSDLNCSFTSLNFSLPEPIKFIDMEVQENMGCMSGEEDGEVTVYFEGGLRPLTVSLGNQSQTVQGNSVTFGNLNGGFYIINFVNPSGCTNWLPTYIPYPIINIEGTVVHANGPNHNPPPSNGSIELQITGGSGQFEFESIKNNVFYSSEKDIFNLMPGYYTVKVTDKLTGCEVTKSFQIEGVLCPSEDKIITYLYHSPTDECPVGANRDWANCEIGCNKKITLSLAINHWDGDLIFPFTVRVFHDNGYDISKEITGYPTLIEFSDLIPSFDPYTVTITNSCGYNIVKEIYACLPCSNIEPYEDGSFIRINDYKDFLIQIVKGCERETSWFGKKSKLIINSTTSPKSKLRLYSGQEYKISWPDSSQAVIKQIWSQGKQAHYIKGSGVYRLNESDFNGEVKTVKIERKDGCTRFYNFRIGYANDVIGIGTSDLNLDGTHATLNKTCQNCNLREFISTFNAYKYSNLCENISDYSKPLKLFHYIPNSANGSNPCIGGTLMRNLPSTNGVMIDAEEYVFPEYLLQNTSWQFRDDNEKEQEWSEGGSLSPVNNIDAGGCIFKKEYMFPQSNINHNLYVNWFRLRSWDYINQPSKQGCGEILNITRKGHIIEINVDPGDQGEKLII